MRRFYVVNAPGKIVGEGLSFTGDENYAIRWVVTDGLLQVQTGRVYPASKPELEEMLEQMRLHLYWLDGLDVPIPRNGDQVGGPGAVVVKT